MAKAPSLRKARTRGTQRTRKLSTGESTVELAKWEGTLCALHGERPQVLSRIP